MESYCMEFEKLFCRHSGSAFERLFGYFIVPQRKQVPFPDVSVFERRAQVSPGFASPQLPNLAF